MDHGSGPVQITVTFDGEAVARQVARSLVETRLAACAQVSGPISSTFRWQGAVRAATEWHCFVKTTVDRIEAIERHVAQVYPADTPEVIAVPIVGGSAAYLDWIRAESTPA
jgi:periplasmic divalent cation tolerance protein